MPQIRVIAATSAPPITMVSLLPTVPPSSPVVASPVLAVSFSARFFLSPPGRELRYYWPTFSNFNGITFFSSHHGLPCDGLFSPHGASSASPRPSSPEEAGWPGPLLETSIIRMPPAFPKKQSSEQFKTGDYYIKSQEHVKKSIQVFTFTVWFWERYDIFIRHPELVEGVEKSASERHLIFLLIWKL